MRFGASTVFIEKPSAEGLMRLIQDYRVTICFTSPTAYRGMLDNVDAYDISSLRKCVSAGEPLPAPTFYAWRDATANRQRHTYSYGDPDSPAHHHAAPHRARRIQMEIRRSAETTDRQG